MPIMCMRAKSKIVMLPVAGLLALTLLLAACGREAEVTVTPGELPADESPPTETLEVEVNSTASVDEPPVVPAGFVLEEIRSRGVIRVGALYNARPFSYLADNGTVQGYEADLMRRVADQWELDIEFHQVTRQTWQDDLAEGRVDVVIGRIPHTRDLEAIVEFSVSTFPGGYRAVVATDSGVESLGQLSGAAVAAIRGDAAQALATWSAEAGIPLDVRVVNVPEEGVAALLERAEVRAVVGTHEDMLLLQSANNELEMMQEPITEEPYGLVVRQGELALRELLDISLYKVFSGGTAGELLALHFYGISTETPTAIPGEPSQNMANITTVTPPDVSVMDRIRAGEAIRIAGLDLASEPLTFDSTPIIDGYNRAVINEMARRWNVPVTELPGTYGDAAVDMVLAGSADIAVGITPDQSRIGQVGQSAAYYDVGLRLIDTEDAVVNGVGDLEFRAVIAVQPVDTSTDMIEENNAFPSVETAETLEDAFRQLIGNVVFAVVGDEYSVVLMSRADNRIQVFERRYRPSARVMIVPRNDGDFHALVNITLQDMYQDGTIERLRQQYFGPYLPEDATLEPWEMEIWPGDSGYLGISTAGAG